MKRNRASQVVPVVVATTTGGGKSKYPRWVCISGNRYRVKSAAEERQLLQAKVDKAQDEAKIALALDDKELTQTIKKRAVTISKRVAAVDTREADWHQILMDEDEELLMFLQ